MKTWTKSQIITFSLLFIWLSLRIGGAILIPVYTNLVSTEIKVSVGSEIELLSAGLYLFLSVVSFPMVILIVILNQDNLRDLNIDPPFAVILLLYGFIEYIILPLPFNCLHGIALMCIAGFLFSRKTGFTDPIQKEEYRKTFLYVTFLFLGCLAFSGFFIRGGRDVFLDISFAVSEEVMYRGVLFLFLTKLGLSPFKSFYVQAFLFWISHVNYLFSNTASFWVLQPIISVILGYIVLRTKSISKSSAAHVLYNVFVTIVNKI